MRKSGGRVHGHIAKRIRSRTWFATRCLYLPYFTAQSRLFGWVSYCTGSGCKRILFCLSGSSYVEVGFGCSQGLSSGVCISLVLKHKSNVFLGSGCSVVCGNGHSYVAASQHWFLSRRRLTEVGLYLPYFIALQGGALVWSVAFSFRGERGAFPSSAFALLNALQCKLQLVAASIRISSRWFCISLIL